MIIEERQNAGRAVEHEMLAFMLEFSPCQQLKVEDVKQIARFARDCSFRHFSEDAS